MKPILRKTAEPREYAVYLDDHRVGEVYPTWKRLGGWGWTYSPGRIGLEIRHPAGSGYQPLKGQWVGGCNGPMLSLFPAG